MLDLTKEYDSYLFGLIIADGSVFFDTRNRGKVRIELNYKDKDIIESIYSRFYYKSNINFRTRTTQYKENYKTIIWSCYQRNFREQLVELGMPIKDKSNLADTPILDYNKQSFWRGFIDGDGSIGMTADNQPFISVVIKSEKLARSYMEFLDDKFSIVKVLNPNKRDSVYNITVKNEDAINVGNYIYNGSTIHLKRKYEQYNKFKDWIRIRPKVNSRSWTLEEDEYILENSLEDSIFNLSRTKNSVNMRLWRLKRNKINNYIDSNN